jgi:hypothetical protein
MIIPSSLTGAAELESAELGPFPARASKMENFIRIAAPSLEVTAKAGGRQEQLLLLEAHMTMVQNAVDFFHWAAETVGCRRRMTP